MYANYRTNKEEKRDCEDRNTCDKKKPQCKEYKFEVNCSEDKMRIAVNRRGPTNARHKGRPRA